MRRFTPGFLRQTSLTAVLLLVILACPPSAAAEPSPDGTTWTLFFYDNADFENAFDPLRAFSEYAHSGPNLNVIVLRDLELGPADLWHIGENHELTRLEAWGEVNMGDPDTLIDFLQWGKTHYPADRYLLAMYGHGGGWTGACRDHTDGDDKLSMNDFQLALTAAGPVDLICFTAPCMMGAIESAHELRDCVDVYVGSEEVSSYGFWVDVIDDICDRLISSPDDPSDVIGSAIVQLVDESDYWQDLSYKTMSATSSGAMAQATASIDQLALDLIPRLGSLTDDIRLARNSCHELCLGSTETFGLIDLYDFTEALTERIDDPVILQDLEDVRTTLDAAVLAECHGPPQERAHGLSIYFHRGGPYHDPGYETAELDFADDTAWDEFLNAYYDSLGLPIATIVTGPGAAEVNPPLVRTFYPLDDGTMLNQWSAYGVQAWGVNVACGDLDGDGYDEVVTGPGPGAVFGPHVRGFSPTGQPVPGVSYLAYGTNKYGVNVACGDLDGDGFDEIVTGAGPGAVFGPHVRGWDVDGGPAEPIPGTSYFAYGTLKWGVNVACGDLDGDGYDEIVTGAGPGAVFGPHVRGWNVDSGTAQPIQSVSFFAYGTLKYGVNVACGDIDGDGRDEILTGPGPSSRFGAHVRGWRYDGTSVSPMPEVNFFAYYFAFTRYGVHLAAADIHGDGIDEIITIPGPDGGEFADVLVWRVPGGEPTLVNRIEFDAYQDLGLTFGGTVAGGHFNIP
jgi:hypothetical protein